MHREVKRGRHVTLQLLWLEWRQDHPDGWDYSQFCQHYKEWLGGQDVVMRLSYSAGERIFVDFSGDKAPYVDADTSAREEHGVSRAVCVAPFESARRIATAPSLLQGHPCLRRPGGWARGVPAGR